MHVSRDNRRKDKGFHSNDADVESIRYLVIIGMSYVTYDMRVLSNS